LLKTCFCQSILSLQGERKDKKAFFMFFCLDAKEPKNQEQMTLYGASGVSMELLLYAICSALLLNIGF